MGDAGRQYRGGVKVARRCMGLALMPFALLLLAAVLTIDKIMQRGSK